MPHEIAAISWQVLCTPLNHAPVYSVDSFKATWGVYVFNCNLPPALLAEWPGSFTCYCSRWWWNGYQSKSLHRKCPRTRKFCCSCWDTTQDLFITSPMLKPLSCPHSQNCSGNPGFALKIAQNFSAKTTESTIWWQEVVRIKLWHPGLSRFQTEKEKLQNVY